jgi:hypothetical protein
MESFFLYGVVNIKNFLFYVPILNCSSNIFHVFDKVRYIWRSPMLKYLAFLSTYSYLCRSNPLR